MDPLVIRSFLSALTKMAQGRIVSKSIVSKPWTDTLSPIRTWLAQYGTPYVPTGGGAVDPNQREDLSRLMRWIGAPNVNIADPAGYLPQAPIEPLGSSSLGHAILGFPFIEMNPDALTTRSQRAATLGHEYAHTQGQGRERLADLAALFAGRHFGGPVEFGTTHISRRSVLPFGSPEDPYMAAGAVNAASAYFTDLQRRGATSGELYGRARENPQGVADLIDEWYGRTGPERIRELLHPTYTSFEPGYRQPLPSHSEWERPVGSTEQFESPGRPVTEIGEGTTGTDAQWYHSFAPAKGQGAYSVYHMDPRFLDWQPDEWGPKPSELGWSAPENRGEPALRGSGMTPTPPAVPPTPPLAPPALGNPPVGDRIR